MLQKYHMRILTIILSIISIIGMTSCSSKPKNQDGIIEKKIIEPNVEVRARENADKKPLWSSSRIGGGGTTYEFATSNVLWKASLQALDFIPLQSANYSGGIIITDWYSADLKSNESIKIEVRFLSSELATSSLKVVSYKKNCENQNCAVTKLTSEFNQDIQNKILEKARAISIEDNKKDPNK
jgi:hypothetical protein